jgi:hypothetical protein
MANEKDVRDAAGNLIGSVKAQVVRDKFGVIIGEVGPPAPEPGESAQDRITRGLRQKSIDAEEAIAGIAEVMSEHAKAARVLIDKTSQWGFRDKRKMEVKVAELRAKFDEGEKQIQKLRSDAAREGTTNTPFIKSLDAHLALMKRHFKTDENPHLNRF